jgi:hypothetical protein
VLRKGRPRRDRTGVALGAARRGRGSTDRIGYRSRSFRGPSATGAGSEHSSSPVNNPVITRPRTLVRGSALLFCHSAGGQLPTVFNFVTDIDLRGPLGWPTGRIASRIPATGDIPSTCRRAVAQRRSHPSERDAQPDVDADPDRSPSRTDAGNGAQQRPRCARVAGS